MSRDVTLVLTDGADVFGALPPFRVSTPWWADVAVVIEAAREITGRDVVILRLLNTSTSSSIMGGQVTYLAQVDRPPAARLPAWNGRDPLARQANRAWWAEPGGLDNAVTWAVDVLAETGIEVIRARQQRTWNLSVLLRLETTTGPVWLKAVPPFLADEGFVLDRLRELDAAAGMLPTVMAHDPVQRMVVFADVPGLDFWEASAGDVVGLGERLVALQREGHERGLPDLAAAGMADRTVTALAAELAAWEQDGLADGPLDPAVRVQATRLGSALPESLESLQALPDVLVHGDPHPGNWRAKPDGGRVLLDWGDVAVASPLADVATLLARLPPTDEPAVRQALAQTVAAAFGVGDLSGAMAALPLLREINGAVVYGKFCRHIEPDELVYHRDDVRACLDRAVTLLDDADQSSGLGL